MPDDDIDRELAVVRQKIAAEIPQLQATIQEARARLASLMATLAALDAVLGVETGRPQGSEAVRRVALEADHSLTIPEIVEELFRRGWAPDSDKPEGAVRAAIRRLRAADPRWQLTGGRLVYDEAPPTDTISRVRGQQRGGA